MQLKKPGSLIQQFTWVSYIWQCLYNFGGKKINREEKDLSTFYDDLNHVSYKLLKA